MEAVVGQGGHTYRVNENWLWQSASTKLPKTPRSS